MNTSFCVGKSAPPDSTREITGRRFCMAISLARKPLRSVHGLLVPPRTVGSFATNRQPTASTTPIPTTVLAPTGKSHPTAPEGNSSANGRSEARGQKNDEKGQRVSEQ